jgi:hypothetical protein
MMLVMLSLACIGSSEEPQPDVPDAMEPPEPAGVAEVVEVAEEPAEKCPEHPLVIVKGGHVSVTFCPPSSKECDEECWAGATVRRADAVIVDLEPVEVSGQIGKPVTVQGEVGPNASEYMAGVWDERRPTCDKWENRPGCEAYGVLDDDLWSWPERNYSWAPDFVDIEPKTILVMDAGGGPALKAKIQQTLEKAANDLGRSRDAKEVKVMDGGKTGNKRQHVEILYRDKWDRTTAWRLAERLKHAEAGFRWTVKQWPEANATFVIAAGGA